MAPGTSGSGADGSCASRARIASRAMSRSASCRAGVRVGLPQAGRKVANDVRWSPETSPECAYFRHARLDGAEAASRAHDRNRRAAAARHVAAPLVLGVALELRQKAVVVEPPYQVGDTASRRIAVSASK